MDKLDDPNEYVVDLPLLLSDLKRFSKESGLGYSRVAQFLGVSNLTLSSWLCGKAKPRRASLQAIAMFLACYGSRRP